MDCVKNIDFPYYNYHDHVGLFDLSGPKRTPRMSPMVEMQSTIRQTMWQRTKSSPYRSQ